MPKFQVFYDVIDRHCIFIEAVDRDAAEDQLNELWETDSAQVYAAELVDGQLTNVEIFPCPPQTPVPPSPASDTCPQPGVTTPA